MTDTLRARLAAALGDRYTLERELTGGGMARVFVAHEAALNRRVVIKTLAPELAASLSAERFDREIQLVAALQQANIVPVHASGAVDGVPWFSMPFVEGDSLRVRLGRGPVTEGEAVGILRDVARALAYAHDRGVVHRDIKPDNILLSGDAAVVTDFGIAKAVTAARTQGDHPAPDAGTITSAGISLGTPAYMAPEQAAADANVDRRADLYALGCVAYELVGGHPPFTGASAAELLRAHLLTPPPPLPAAADASRGYAALVARCLAKDPGQRPASAREVLGALEQLGGAGEAAGMGGGLPRALAVWGATLVATYVLARAALVGIGLPDFTVAWATGAAALGLPVVLATWWVQRTARRAQLATPTWTPGGTLTQTTLAGLAIKASPYATWRRARQFGLIAVAAAALLLTGVMGLRQFGVGPAASLMGAGRVKAGDRLVLADFTSAVADSAMAAELTQAVRYGLASSTMAALVPAAEVARQLQFMLRDPGTPVTGAVARDVALRTGAPLVIAGRVVRAGASFLVTVDLRDAASDSVVTSLRREAANGKLVDAIDALTREVRARLGESLRTVNRTPAQAEVTTPSLPALRIFSASGDAVGGSGDYVAGLRLALEATRLDSAFGMAWRRAASYSYFTGQPRSEALGYARTARQVAGRRRLTPTEQLQVEGWYQVFTSTQQAVAVFRRDSTMQGAIGASIVLRQLGRPREALALLLDAMRRDSATGRVPSVSVLTNLAGNHFESGQLAQADSVNRLLRQMAPGAYYVHTMTLSLRWRRSGMAALVAAAESLRGSADPRLAHLGADFRARTMGTVGQLRAYEQAMERLAPPAGGGVFRAGDPLVDAIVAGALHRQQPEQGVRRLDSLQRADPQGDRPAIDRRDLQLAIAYARLGRPDVARKLLAGTLRALSREERLARWNVWHAAEGEIALAEGRADDAIAAFRRAAASDSGFVQSAIDRFTAGRLAMAFDKGGRADSATAYFALVADPPTMNEQAPLMLPYAVRRLGELAEARGDLSEALRRYRAFAQLWRNADPELQEQVADVRRRIAALEAREARAR
ncbi:MAG: protein kinase [Gemmatimonadetes bacterium]|nr:protein kinase [Gemmatimonadota bacterium]